MYGCSLTHVVNRVFILHPRSKQHCHAALCQHIHEKLKKPYSEHEVTLEPLVDWMTLDPVADITPLWFTLFRRNKSLLHKFALTNSKFVPRKPLRFCLECLSFMADERNLVWCIIKEEPDIIYADVPMPWPMSNHDNDGNKSEEKGNKSSEEPWSSDSDSDDSNSDESDKTITALKPAATHELVSALREVELNHANHTISPSPMSTEPSISRPTLAPGSSRSGAIRQLIRCGRTRLQQFNSLSVRRSVRLQTLRGGPRSTFPSQ